MVWRIVFVYAVLDVQVKNSAYNLPKGILKKKPSFFFFVRFLFEMVSLKLNSIFHKNHFISLSFVYSWNKQFRFCFIKISFIYVTPDVQTSVFVHWNCQRYWLSFGSVFIGWLRECPRCMWYITLCFTGTNDKVSCFIFLYLTDNAGNLIFSSWSDWRRVWDLIVFWSRNVFLHRC